MNKLYFRAWLKDEKRMVEVDSIDLSSPTPENGGFREVSIWDVDGEYYEGFIGIHIDIMQGFKINDQIIYECDIIKIKGDYIDEAIVKADDFGFFLIDVVEPRFGKDYPMEDLQYADVKILGNIYENKEVVENE